MKMVVAAARADLCCPCNPTHRPESFEILAHTSEETRISGGFPKLGVPIWGPNNKDYGILGSILGYLYFGKLPSRKIILSKSFSSC